MPEFMAMLSQGEDDGDVDKDSDDMDDEVAERDSVHHNMGLNQLEAQHNLGTDSLGLPQQMCPEDPNSTQLITASKKPSIFRLFNNTRKSNVRHLNQSIHSHEESEGEASCCEARKMVQLGEALSWGNSKATGP
ncbi:hypothetical protein D5086_011930 [Populus alba]|uniref:Uncharacterized protein n=1 Tax=Populus alba TaxID=43335 RepID=A0ACC4C265_POPAL